MTRRFDLSRDGAFVPADRPKPDRPLYDDAGRRVVEDSGRLLFADELPEEPGLEDVLVRHIAQVWTRLRTTARRTAPMAVAGSAWATAVAGQVSAASVCQAVMVCALTAAGGSTLHYWQKAHPIRTQPQPGTVGVAAGPARAAELADADPPAPPPRAQELPAHIDPSTPAEDAPAAAPAHALGVQEQLPLAAVPNSGAADADVAPARVAGATLQKAAMMEDAVPDEVSASGTGAPAAAPKGAALKGGAPARVGAARLAVRSAPTVRPPPVIVRVAPAVVVHAAPTHRFMPRVIMTRFDMPRWLSVSHAPRPAITMSAPPHNLAAPQDRSLLAPDGNSDRLNVPAAQEDEPARPVLAVVPHRDRFAAPYRQPAYYPRPAYYPPAAYYPPYGPYGYSYGRY